MNTKRLHSLDALRGGAVALILLFHSSIYNYARIHLIDFSDPPIIIVLLSFMALWGGVFIVLSMTVNAYAAATRQKEGGNPGAFRHTLVAVLLLLAAHYLLNIFLGRWNVDFVNNQPDYTFVAGSLRSGRPTLPHITKLYDGSSLSTIALNLLICSAILHALFRKGGSNKLIRNCLILGISGLAVLGLSFLRVPLYPRVWAAVEGGNGFLGVLHSFFLANPYPLLPYLSYGLFGALIGLLIAGGKKKAVKAIILPMGALLLAVGIGGMSQLDKSISTPDYFWYFKTIFEAGLFLLIVPGVWLAFEGRKIAQTILKPLAWLGRASLTVYLLETLVSELLRFVWTPLFPGWDQSINGCLLFGAAVILVWLALVSIWQRWNFRFSLEWLWVRLFRKLGKESGKLHLYMES